MDQQDNEVEDDGRLNEHIVLRDQTLTFMKSPGWDRMKKMLEEMTVHRMTDFLKPAIDTAASLRNEYTKGEISMIQTILADPQAIVDQCNDIIDAYEELAQPEDEE